MRINNSNISFKAYRISKNQAQHIDSQLKQSSKVDIICHETTDRDAANSALAMSDYLSQQGINTRIILSQNLKSLTLRTEKKNILQAKDLKDNETPDTILCVDFSQKNRVAPNVYNFMKKTDKIIGLDHHMDADIVDDNLTLTQNSNEKPTDKISSFYIDTTAKSATSIIYRFFEALDKEISQNTAYDLFFGLIRDCCKKGLVKCDGENGTISPNKEMIQDKNAYEIYQALYNKLNPEQISDMAKKIDIMSNLSEKEKAFSDSLYKRVKYNNKGNVAYVEISPNDPTWIELGGDNSTTSTILNRFRQNFLKNHNNIKAVFTFYEADNSYRLSVHSKEKNLKKFYKFALKNVQNKPFTIGGHEDRGGGKINSTDEKVCHKWTENIISLTDLL